MHITASNSSNRGNSLLANLSLPTTLAHFLHPPTTAPSCPNEQSQPPSWPGTDIRTGTLGPLCFPYLLLSSFLNPQQRRHSDILFPSTDDRNSTRYKPALRPGTCQDVTRLDVEHQKNTSATRIYWGDKGDRTKGVCLYRGLRCKGEAWVCNLPQSCQRRLLRVSEVSPGK